MKYDVDYFINKFQAIPEGLWCAGIRHSGDGKHCAHGWCDLDDTKDSIEEEALKEVFFPLKNGLGVARINNGTDIRYQQPTPKQRILAALHDIKKLQQPTITEVQSVGNFIPVTFSQIEELQGAN